MMNFYDCLSQWSGKEQIDMWFFVGLALGYFTGRAASALTQPVLDRVLVWDTGVFAWRAVPTGTKLDQSKRYLAATEIAPQDFDGMHEKV